MAADQMDRLRLIHDDLWASIRQQKQYLAEVTRWTVAGQAALCVVVKTHLPNDPKVFAVFLLVLIGVGGMVANRIIHHELFRLRGRLARVLVKIGGVAAEIYSDFITTYTQGTFPVRKTLGLFIVITGSTLVSILALFIITPLHE